MKNEYSKLKHVVVGREFINDIDEIYYKEFEDFYNLKNFNFKEYLEKVKKNINERNEDIDNLAKILEERGIRVTRPSDPCNNFLTDYFIGSNIRDIMFTIGDYIIITNSPMTMRSFEYSAYVSLLNSEIHNKKIIQIPVLDRSLIKIDSEQYDYNIYDPEDFSDCSEYYPVFEAANIIKHNNKLIMNVSNKNEYSGYLYLKRLLPYEIYPVFIDKNHIDGALNILNDKVALACFDSNKISFKRFKEKLPNFIQEMDIIQLDKNPQGHDDAKNRVIASMGGMFINVLSLDKNTVITNKYALHINNELESRGFEVIKIQYRHPRLFGGGIHCTTLDIEREDD